MSQWTAGQLCSKFMVVYPTNASWAPPRGLRVPSDLAQGMHSMKKTPCDWDTAFRPPWGPSPLACQTHTHTHTHTHHAPHASPGARQLLPIYICQIRALLFMGKVLCLCASSSVAHTKEMSKVRMEPPHASQEAGHMVAKTASLGVWLTGFQSHPLSLLPHSSHHPLHHV